MTISAIVAVALAPMVCFGDSAEKCLPESHPSFTEWQSLGEPQCWCYPRQCHGDADGLKTGNSKTGFANVGPADLNILVNAWLVKEPPHGPGIDSVPNGVCADFDHSVAGNSKTGYYRVGAGDLAVLVANWLVKEPPKGPGLASVVDGICADFAHDLAGSAKTGLYRVGPSDLNILINNWLLREPPKGPGIPQDCLECP